MDLALTGEQEALREHTRAAVVHCCPPERARAIDAEARFPGDLYAEITGGPLRGLAVPKEFGGVGAGLLDVAVACEELTRGAVALSLAYGGSMVAAWAIARYGTMEQRRAILRRCAAGEEHMALAVPESADLVAVSAAPAPGGGYVLDGASTEVPGAHIAGHLVIPARSAPGTRGSDGLTWFCVPRDGRGVVVNVVDRIGARALPGGDVALEAVPASSQAVLGPIDEGGGIFDALCGAYRIVVAAGSTGLAQVIFDAAVAHARQPRNGAKPLAHSQAIQHLCATLHTRIEAGRLLAYHAAWCADAGRPHVGPAALAKAYTGETLRQAVEAGVRVFGRAAMRSDGDMQRYLRDARPLEVFPAGPEADKDVLAHGMGL